ncbi:hypothetical protein EM20IM_01095 [Candidatus Methylacidiphilum infernorum]|uniref:Uncharacterized protein n=1 Tax=Candidatus Methylacidiphilum infernorum TaxID=511746 RepID=A0ABX7PWP9_9BACT|nr:hypothetical protein [Candidatus Methylacidiphilum infernorum]QSR86996.1 hypothetical protein EM20IM_01095 [Candidatus Methylacidiphilum infernorum]
MIIELPISWQKSSYQPHLIALIDSKGKWIADVPSEEIAVTIISALENSMRKQVIPEGKIEEKTEVKEKTSKPVSPKKSPLRLNQRR